MEYGEINPLTLSCAAITVSPNLHRVQYRSVSLLQHRIGLGRKRINGHLGRIHIVMTLILKKNPIL